MASQPPPRTGRGHLQPTAERGPLAGPGSSRPLAAASECHANLLEVAGAITVLKGPGAVNAPAGKQASTNKHSLLDALLV